jgi:hypothetical protein
MMELSLDYWNVSTHVHKILFVTAYSLAWKHWLDGMGNVLFEKAINYDWSSNHMPCA